MPQPASPSLQRTALHSQQRSPPATAPSNARSRSRGRVLSAPLSPDGSGTLLTSESIYAPLEAPEPDAVSFAPTDLADYGPSRRTSESHAVSAPSTNVHAHARSASDQQTASCRRGLTLGERMNLVRCMEEKSNALSMQGGGLSSGTNSTNHTLDSSSSPSSFASSRRPRPLQGLRSPGLERATSDPHRCPNDLVLSPITSPRSLRKHSPHTHPPNGSAIDNGGSTHVHYQNRTGLHTRKHSLDGMSPDLGGGGFSLPQGANRDASGTSRPVGHRIARISQHPLHASVSITRSSDGHTRSRSRSRGYANPPPQRLRGHARGVSPSSTSSSSSSPRGQARARRGRFSNLSVVLSFLSLRDILSVCQVNKNWCRQTRQYLAKLRVLDLRECWHVLGRMEHGKQAFLEKFIGAMSQIQVLRLSYCHHLTDSLLARMLKVLAQCGCPLREVHLFYCGSLTDRALTQIVLRAPKLQVLDLSRCRGLTSRGLYSLTQLRELKWLSLRGLAPEVVNDEVLMNLEDLAETLRYLDVRDCDVDADLLDEMRDNLDPSCLVLGPSNKRRSANSSTSASRGGRRHRDEQQQHPQQLHTAAMALHDDWNDDDHLSGSLSHSMSHPDFRRPR
ncbi:MAG: hypothetical protein MHM6MM_000579 [Cercozoa sp. M6MM]